MTRKNIEFLTAFYDRLDRLIEASGKSAAEVSIAAGMERSGIRQMRRSMADPKFLTAARIADALGVSLAELLGIEPGSEGEAMALRIAAMSPEARARALRILQAIEDE